ncbi:MAG: Bacterial Ig-like domain group 2 protein [Mucilaginibacter sp.]|nr:Bacterial Ig-like domain group 2 protein [Mucilaginibacter sp.]
MKSAILILFIFFSVTFLITSCVKEVKTEPDHSVIISFDTLRLSAGTSKQLVSKNYSANDLTWTSSDSTVAIVSNAGLITTLKQGSAIINVKSNTYAVSATCNVTVTDVRATDVGVGADGSVFVVGADSVSVTGGYGIYKLTNSQFHKLPDCAAIRVAVSPQGVPWVVNKSHLIFRYNGSTWDQLPGTATDIGIGADGSVFAIGTQFATATGGYIIMKWNGSAWDTMPDCAGIHIAVAPNGIPWVVNQSKLVFRYGGTYLWDTMYGVEGNDVGVGADGSVFVTGTDTTIVGYKPPIYKFINGGWSQIVGISGTSISVDPLGKIWYTDKSYVLHRP